MDMGNPPGIASSVRCMIDWAMDIRQADLHNATVQATNGYLRSGLHIPHSLVLSMAQFRLGCHNLGLELGKHQGVVWFAHGCK
jgi:hypothetical protein